MSSDKPPTVEFILGEDAILPKAATEKSAGYDLFMPVDFTIKAKSIDKVNIRIKYGGVENHVGLIRDRSSVATQQKCIVVAGVIDEDYRGEWRVAMYNTTDEDVTFRKGDRIAQVLFVPITTNMNVVQVDTLSETERGEGGFGSTGK